MKDWYQNTTIRRLVIMLLILVNLYVLSTFQSIFNVISSSISSVVPPLMTSIVVYYVVRPSVDRLERSGLSRLQAIIFVFIIVSGLIVIAVSSLLPVIQHQSKTLIASVPELVDSLKSQLSDLLTSTQLLTEDQFKSAFQKVSSIIASESQATSKSSIDAINKITSSLANVMISIAMMPFIVFYLLKDQSKILRSTLSVVPTQLKDRISTILTVVDHQVETYIQGQIVVSVIVSIIFIVLFKVINLPYATTFGIVGGLLNMIPYFGSLMTSMIVILFSATISPIMLFKVVTCLVIEQTLEGRVVTPQIIGRQLEIHPVTIMIVLLISNSIFGLTGVFIAIPVYSIIKFLVVEIFNEYKSKSQLF